MIGEDKIKNLTESFTYDKLNRLTGSHVAGQDAITLEYKDNGNIFSKSDVGGDDYTYKYGKNGAGLHAVTSVSSPLPHDCIVWFKNQLLHDYIILFSKFLLYLTK